MAHVNRVHPTKVRAKRASLGQDLVVHSRTLGAAIDYCLIAENISKSGLLVSSGNYKRIPYLVNTLLEMTIDPNESIFSRPIHCLGKIVRVEEGQTELKRFGIHIVQMDDKEQTEYEGEISRLMEKGLLAPIATTGGY